MLLCADRQLHSTPGGSAGDAVFPGKSVCLAPAAQPVPHAPTGTLWRRVRPDSALLDGGGGGAVRQARQQRPAPLTQALVQGLEATPQARATYGALD